jgi:hypothetical protein
MNRIVCNRANRLLDGAGGIRINSASGIVSELLNMLRAGAADLDRWETGLRGLSVLGLL